MSDRIQVIPRGDDDAIASIDSGIVPETDSFIRLDGDDWQVYHVTHTITDGDHVVTVFVWQPNGGWPDEKIEQMVADTLRQQRRAERNRTHNTEAGDE